MWYPTVFEFGEEYIMIHSVERLGKIDKQGADRATRVLHQEWRIETNAWAVERPFKPPNWFRSRVGARKSQSQSATNDSRIFPRTGSKEIGLRSDEILSYHFPDKRRFRPKITIFSIPTSLCLTPSVREFPLEFRNGLWWKKLDWCSYQNVNC